VHDAGGFVGVSLHLDGKGPIKITVSQKIAMIR
jgi:hypothetical protein